MRKSRRCQSCRLEYTGTAVCAQCKIEGEAKPIAKNVKLGQYQYKVGRKGGKKAGGKGNYSVSLPVSQEQSRAGTPNRESKGTQVRFQKDEGRLDTLGVEAPRPETKDEELRISSSETLEDNYSLRTQLLQALSYQDCLYQEIRRITLFLEAEKHRWLEQIKCLKDEHFIEVEALKRAYEEKVKLAQSSCLTAHPLIATCDKEELRASLESQYRTSLALIKEQVKRQYDLENQQLRTELARHEQEEKARQQRDKEEARLELEDRRRERRQYEEMVQARVSAIKGEHERKLREMQQQNQDMKRDLVALRKPVSEHSTRPLQQVLCCRCHALVQMSALLDGKLDRLEQ